LVRSWKQITKFKPDGAAGQPQSAAPTGAAAARLATDGEESNPASAVTGAEGWVDAAGREPLTLKGLIRDERGVRFAPETED
jgi:hypothetical protein